MSELKCRSGWQHRSLLSLAQYHNGYAFKESDWGDEGLPIIRIEQITDPDARSDHYAGPLLPHNVIDDGDLVFSWSATLKVVIWNHGPGALNQHLFKVVPNPGIDRAFLKHLLDGNMDRISLSSQGSTMKHVTRKELARYEVCVPLEERAQQRIAKILSTVDEAIEGTEKLIAKHQQIKAGLMHDLFTRGLTPDGHLRPPHSECPGLYKVSPLGWIPKEWDAVRLEALARNRDSERIPLKQEDRADMQGHYRYYGASGIIDWVDSYIFDGDYVLLGEDGENVMSRNLPLAFRVTGQFWANNHAHVFEPLEDVDIRFLTELLERTNYAPLVSGSAQPKITQKGLQKLWFLKPQFGEQACIADALEQSNHLIAREATYLEKLRVAKQGLMHDLLTGEVPVPIPEAEDHA